MQHTRRLSWLFSFACVLCTLPLWMSHYPPMVDIPQHAAQIASIKGILQGEGPFAGLFELKYFNPYWLGYGLVLALSYPFGILLSIKLVLAVSMAALPWSAACFCHKAGVDGHWTWLLLLMPFGFAHEWGFLNFIVAMPLAFLFLSDALDLRDRSDAWIVARIVAWAHFLFLAHILIAGFACAVACLMLSTPWRGAKAWLRRCVPLFSVLPVTILWLWLGLRGSAQAAEPIQWSLGLHRVYALVPRMVAAPDALAGWAVGLFALASPWLFGARPDRSPGHWLPFTFYLGWMLLFPNYAVGNAFTAQRFAVFGLPLYFLCFRPISAHGPARRILSQLMPSTTAIIVGAMLAWHSLRATVFDDQTQGYAEVMQHAKPEGRLLSLMIDRRSLAYASPSFLHFPGWYQAEHGGLSEFSFSRFYVTPLKFRDAQATSIEQGFAWNPQAFDWRAHHGDRYDYVLVRSMPNPDGWIAQRSACRLQPIVSSGPWHLYGRATGSHGDCSASP